MLTKKVRRGREKVHYALCGNDEFEQSLLA